MSTTPIAAKDRFVRSFTTTEITQAALGLSRAYGPNVGSAGLRVDQIKDAILRLGYDVISEQQPHPDLAHALCYGYTESGIPPIAVLYLPEIKAWHAVAFIGHALDGKIPGLTYGNRVITSASYAQTFLIHDDRDGPYLRVKVEPSKDKQGNIVGTQVVRQTKGQWSYGELTHLLIPIPPRIALDYRQAVAQGIELLDEFGWQQGRVLDKEVVMRPVLIRSSSFKNHLLSRSSMPRQVKAAFRRLPMPRYIWLLEYAAKGDWSPGAVPPEISIFGEAILDSTLPDSVATALLGIHMPGFAQTLSVNGSRTSTKHIRVNELHTYDSVRVDARP